MDEAKGYKTAGAFRTALETRLQTRAREEATDLQRLMLQEAAATRFDDYFEFLVGEAREDL